MIDLINTMNYKEYLQGYTLEEASKQKERYDQTVLSVAAVEKIKDLKDKTNIIVFAEGFCPDCHVVIPFVSKISDLNSNIKTYFMNRTGNEKLLNDAIGEARIPTIMFFSEAMELRGVYIEFPEELKKKMSGKNIEEVKEIVNKYRQGNYNDLIENEIVNLLYK